MNASSSEVSNRSNNSVGSQYKIHISPLRCSNLFCKSIYLANNSFCPFDQMVSDIDPFLPLIHDCISLCIHMDLLEMEKIVILKNIINQLFVWSFFVLKRIKGSTLYLLFLFLFLLRGLYLTRVSALQELAMM